MKRARKTIALLSLAVAGCATPMTQIGSVSREQVVAEQFKEQQLAIQAMVADQRRIDDVSYGLLKAAAPLCADALRSRLGVVVINRAALSDNYVEAARALGYTDTLELESVAKGSAADRAGLQARDRLLAVNGEPLSLHGDSRSEFSKRVDATTSRVSLTYIRDSVVRTVSVPRDTVCDYDVEPTKDPGLSMNAVSTGKQIFVSTTLMRFAADDDELAIVVGHEIGHSAMHHIDSKHQNALLGALAGALVDIAFAKGGVNTYGRYSNDFAKMGAVAFSQDFEREADYVGLNIAAAAGRDVNAAPRFWRRMAQDDPTGITFASSHPTTAERYVRLDQWGKEIGRQVAAGQGLRLAMKDGSQSAALTVTPHAPTDLTSAAPKVLAQGTPASPRVTQDAHVVANGGTASLNGAAPAPVNTSPITKPSDRTPPATRAPASRHLQADSTVAIAVIGAPASDSARAAAITEYALGRVYYDRREWGKAEAVFKHTLQLDGSLANYHAALGSVEMALEKWADAEAEYVAASMIDLSNQEYRAQILEARRRKHP